MKGLLLAIVVIILISTQKVIGQVSNDSCLSATDLGMLPSGVVTPCFVGLPNVPIIDTTTLAVANFPYPTTSSTCSGYSASIASPAKDRWYKFTTNCDLSFGVESSDTLHISFWFGDTCSNLIPIACYTIPASISFSQTLPASLGQHTVYLQISGQNNSVNSQYSFCLAGSAGSCVPVYDFSAPTPVTCFIYGVNHTNCSNLTANDGSIVINVSAGNSPYTCIWNDGFNGFTRSNLSVGTYSFVITDFNGCSEMDSVNIALATLVPSIDTQQNFALTIEPVAGLAYFIVKVTNCINASLAVYNITGQVLLKQPFSSIAKLDISNLTSGVYIVRVINKVGLSLNGKIVR